MDKEDVRRVLTADWYYRKKKRWPLIEVEVPLGAGKVLVEFDLLETILQKWSGKLAACGGAVTRMLINDAYDQVSKDVDLFFYGVNEDEANHILEDCVATLVSKATEIDSVRIEHRVNITNVAFIGDDYTYVYQFVHRIYPTLDSIIGAFDIPLCMFSLTYDGGQLRVHGTPLAMFCRRYKCIIIDTTRRSTSYEYRIMKYVDRYRASVYFPGLDAHSICKTNEANYTKACLDRKTSKLEAFMNDLGLKLKDQCDLAEVVEFSGPVEYLDDEEQDELWSNRCQHEEDCTCQFPPNFSYNFTNMRLKTDPNVPERWSVKFDPNDVKATTLIKYSDYSDSRVYDRDIPAANGSMLRCNNLNGVFVSRSYNATPTYETVVADFRRLLSEPVILYDVDRYTKSLCAICKHNRHITVRTLVGHFAEKFIEMRSYLWKSRRHARSIERSLKCVPIRQQLIERMHSNAKICTEMLRGIKWMTSEPGRQWTASINPIIKDPRDFYGQAYIPFHIGIPREVESTLRLARLRDTVWRWLPKDVFKLILEYVLRHYM